MRFRTVTPTEDPPASSGDIGFRGVDMRHEAHLLEPGMCSFAMNMRFNRGIAETRLGTTFQTWCNKIISGVPQAWGTIYGVGVFSDPLTHLQFLIIAADGKVYYTLPNNLPVEMALPSGVTVVLPTVFSQAFNVLLLHQGPTMPTLVATSIYSGFTEVVQTDHGDGTAILPNAYRSMFAQNRLFVPFGDDEVAVSDFGDYTRFLPGLQEFRINQGSADKLINIYKYNDSTIIAFKDHSIYSVTGVSGDLSGALLDEVTSKFGLAAAKSIAHVGNDLWFLSELGVMSLRQTELNTLQGEAIPQSDAIQPLIDRINWRYASESVAAYWNNRYYLAVPLDDAEVIGDELVPQRTFVSLTSIPITTIAGATYRWTQGDTSLTLTNGTETLTHSSDFIAQGTTVTLSSADFGTVTDSLKRVHKGVNNAILVYDFLNQAWSGYDQAEGLMVKDFFLLNYQGRRRLFFIANDGWVKLYEESFEDALAIPYTDVTVTGTPVTNDTLSVNGGTIITAISGLPSNLPDPFNNWGCFTDSYGMDAGDHLFVDQFNVGGYWDGASSGWTNPRAPNTIVVPIDGGVRFYATNGVAPTVDAPNWVTVVEHSTVPITATFISRAYTNPQQDLELFSWLSSDLQTWNPSFSIDVLTEGAAESSSVVADQTKDGTKFYRPFTKADYVTGNAAGDYNDPYRQDYSLGLGHGVKVWGTPEDNTVWGDPDTNTVVGNR